jgi:hypothetical protein
VAGRAQPSSGQRPTNRGRVTSGGVGCEAGRGDEDARARGGLAGPRAGLPWRRGTACGGALRGTAAALGEVALALLLLLGRQLARDLGLELHAARLRRSTRKQGRADSTARVTNGLAQPRAARPVCSTPHISLLQQDSTAGHPFRERLLLKGSAHLDGGLDGGDHLLDVVANVLLSRALEGDLGAHQRHEDAHLHTRGVSARSHTHGRGSRRTHVGETRGGGGRGQLALSVAWLIL